MQYAGCYRQLEDTARGRNKKCGGVYPPHEKYTMKYFLIIIGLVSVSFLYTTQVHATVPENAFGVNSIQRLPGQTFKPQMWCGLYPVFGVNSHFGGDGIIDGIDSNGYPYIDTSGNSSIEDGFYFMNETADCFNTASTTGSFKTPIPIPTDYNGFNLWVIAWGINTVDTSVTINGGTATTTFSNTDAYNSHESFTIGGITYQVIKYDGIPGYGGLNTEGYFDSIFNVDNNDEWNITAVIYTNADLHEIDTSNELLEYLDLLYGAISPSSLSNSIEITFPEDATTTNKFVSFYVDYNLNTSTSTPLSNYILGINYGTTTTNLDKNATQIPITWSNDNMPIPVGETMPNGDIYAQPYIKVQNCSFETLSCSSYTLVTGSIISFNKQSDICDNIYCDPTLDAENIINSFFATTTSAFTTFCEEFKNKGWWTFGDWDYKACRLGAVFFQPHQSTFTKISENFQVLKSLFPFNIFFNFLEVSKNALSQNQTGQNLSINFPIIDSVDILTPTILNDTIGSETKNKLFEIQSNLMWLGIGFLMVKKTLTLL